ncbi:hypothetical protein [Methylomagnum sp.]
MATANSTRREPTRPYSAPSPAERSPLATLIKAVGDLKVTGYDSNDAVRLHWNTDPESLRHLENHTQDARYVVGLGIAALGDLLYTAAGNEDAGDIGRDTLMNTGLLIRYLAESLIPLAELEESLKNSTGQVT